MFENFRFLLDYSTKRLEELRKVCMCSEEVRGVQRGFEGFKEVLRGSKRF